MTIFSTIQTYAVLGAGILMGVAASGTAFYLYNNLVDNPRILKDARKGYALESTVMALEGQLEKERYYRNLANEARDKATQSLIALSNKQKERDANAQDKISTDNPSGRPSASDSDVEWLRNSYGPKASSPSTGAAKGPTNPP